MHFLEKFMHYLGYFPNYTSEFGTFLLPSLAFYKLPILLKFSSNGGLACTIWGLFSTKSLILENIFHNSLSQKFTILPPSTDQVPTKYRPSSSQKFAKFVTGLVTIFKISETDVVFNI
jgi:hypothetical protein